MLYCEEGCGFDVAGLRDFLDGRIALYKIPQYIWVHDAPLPKLGTGKIDKKTLRERYSAGVGGG